MMTTKAEPTGTFDIAESDYLDRAEMTVRVNGKATTWKWYFAGPGHENTVRYNERTARDRLHREAMQEQARVNGRKWKADEESVDEARARNINWIVARLLGWSVVKLNGEDYPFSEENARKLLADPKKPFFGQAVEFLAEEGSFTTASANS